MLSRVIARSARSFTTSGRVLSVQPTTGSSATATQAPVVSSEVSRGTADSVAGIEEDEDAQGALSISKYRELDQKFYDLLTGNTTDETTAKILQNRELVDELKQLREEISHLKIDYSVIASKRHKSQVVSNSGKYPFLKKSSKEEPFTKQELFVRRAQFLEQNEQLGSKLEDVYVPHHDTFYPSTAQNLTISKLLAAGAHMGHSTSLWRPSTQPYIYGIYKGIHIIDLEQTLAHLKKAARVVDGVASKGGIVLFVGTNDIYRRVLEIASQRCRGYYVASRWIPGTLTNATRISGDWERHEVDLGGNATKRELQVSEKKSIVKPDLIVFLNPVENRVALAEAIKSRIPTIGIIDTDSEPSLVTYPIPANDDSIRAVSLIVGVLAKAGEAGHRRLVSNFLEYNKSKEAELI